MYNYQIRNKETFQIIAFRTNADREMVNHIIRINKPKDKKWWNNCTTHIKKVGYDVCAINGMVNFRLVI